MRRYLLVLALAALSVGCSHAEVKPDASASEGGGPGMKESVQGGETVKSFDLNGDDKPDAFDYYASAKDAEGKPSLTLLRKEFDLNGDGKVDMWRWYDEKENVTRESLDVDFDGRLDVTDFFEKGQKVREERDYDEAKKAHTWVYYEKNAIVKKERDLHARGRPDYWEYWENGVIDRIGIDSDGDGQVDHWKRNPATAEK